MPIHTSSDWVRRRKPLVLLGYGLSACVKPLFAIADSASAVLAARVADRLGKGIRDAPRDALVADITPCPIRGSGYGLRHALYTTGAVAGPLAAMALMTVSAGDFRLVFWIAVIPAAVSVAILALGVREGRDDAGERPRRSFRRGDIRSVPPLLWWTIALEAILTMSRFSPAFLVLRAHSLGIDDALVPIAWVLMHAVYGATAYPFGVLSDRVDRRFQLGLGVVCLIGAHVTLAAAGTVEALTIGIVLWGLQQGIIQGLLSAMIANAAPDHLRGTAFGLCDLGQGIATFLASAGAGLLWALGGPTASFLAAALLAAMAGMVLVGLPAAPTRRRDTSAAAR